MYIYIYVYTYIYIYIQRERERERGGEREMHKWELRRSVPLFRAGTLTLDY